MSDSERRLGDDKILLDVSAATKDRLLLGLGVLTVEMSSDKRKAQPWIFFGVDGDEDCVGLVFCSQGREGIKKETEEQREYMDVLSPD